MSLGWRSHTPWRNGATWRGLGLAAPSPPGNGPSGGAGWLSGYFPRVGGKLRNTQAIKLLKIAAA